MVERKTMLKIGDHVWIREKDNDEGKMVLSGVHLISGIRKTEEKEYPEDPACSYYQYKIFQGQSFKWYDVSELFDVKLTSISGEE